jgi:hypothetical protein
MSRISPLYSFTLLILIVSTAPVPDPALAYDNDNTHQYVCTQATELFNFPELAVYLGQVTYGAWHEDEYDHVYDTSGAWITLPHFWVADEGDDQINWWGAYGYENAWMKSRIMILRSRDAWMAGDRAEAYHMLGHVCHLLADMTVPAHAHYDEHADDAYEDWMAGWYSNVGATSASVLAPVPEITDDLIQEIMDYWGGVAPGPINLMSSLYYLMYTANQRADYFASDDVDGNLDERHGWVDYTGWPSSPRTTDDLTDNDDGDNDDDGDLSRVAFHCYAYAMTATARLYEAWRDHLDNEPPHTTAHYDGPAPVHNGWVPDNLVATLVPHDNAGGSGVFVTNYGSSATPLLQYTEPVTLDHEGIRFFYYRSEDWLGNWEEAEMDTIKIDRTPPAVTVTSPDPATFYLSSGSLILDFAATDHPSGIWAHTATLDGEPVTNGQTFDLSQLAGRHTFTVTAEDMAGNLSTSAVDFEVLIHATVRLQPTQLDLGSGGGAMTMFIAFPAPYDVALIAVPTVVLTAGAVDVPVDPKLSELVSIGNDGLLERSFKLRRRDICSGYAGQTGIVEPVATGRLTNDSGFWGTGMLNVFTSTDKLATGGGVLPTHLDLWPFAEPSAPGAVIAYALPSGGDVRVRLFDLRGRVVADFGRQNYTAGIHRLVWDGSDGQGSRAACGMYLVRLDAAEGTLIRKFTLIH